MGTLAIWVPTVGSKPIGRLASPRGGGGVLLNQAVVAWAQQKHVWAKARSDWRMGLAMSINMAPWATALVCITEMGVATIVYVACIIYCCWPLERKPLVVERAYLHIRPMCS